MGPQLALIGDSPSGKGEAVIPFAKMGRFLDMAGAQLTAHHSSMSRAQPPSQGQDILLTNERDPARNRTRVRNF